MINLAIKYLNGELTSEEKERFFVLVAKDETLKNDLIKYHHYLLILVYSLERKIMPILKEGFWIC